MGSQTAAQGEYGAYENDEEALKRTVSTFPLEGLAYLPPPLVNTVRYWSRHTPTAEWKYLDYDSGRWAYTAVNVSDYLDINRLKANVMRDSSPSNRISLAFLFEDPGDHSNWGTVKPSAFDKQMQQLANSAEGRLVSMADYNLALDVGGPLSQSGFKSPFCEYVRNPSGDGSFYGALEEQARQQQFVTDSWYPGTNTAGVSSLCLADGSGQPFFGIAQSLDLLRKESTGKGSGFEQFADRLDLCTLAAFYDYVDEDDVPISLAVPTIERAPMLTGIRIQPANFAVVLESEKKEIDGAAGEQHKDELFTFKIKELGNGPSVRVSGCGVFPFKRTSGLSGGSYKVQALVKMFFSDTALEETRVTGTSFRPKDKADWKNDDALLSSGTACLTLFGEQALSVPNGALDENGTTFQLPIIDLELPPNAAVGAHVYGYLQKWKLDENGFAVEDEAVWDPSEMARPLPYRTGKSVKTLVDAGAAGVPLRLNFVCWVRILDDGGNTVDLVPATLSDDAIYNDHKSVGSIDGGTDDLGEICGTREPQIPVSTDVVLQMDLTKAKQGGAQTPPTTLGGLTIYCDDPRFNYAPEDWYYAGDNVDVDALVWLAAAKGRCDGNDHRSADIFQFVSDQNYLQSMGELQFLPYLRKFELGGDQISGDFYKADKYNGDKFTARTTPGQLANHDFAWKTHCAFGQYADWHDGYGCNPYEWGISDSNGGVTINRYAERELFMAALANTPYDYIVAAEQENEADKDLEKNIKLCFNARSDEARVEWSKLQEVADLLRQNFIKEQDNPWERWGSTGNSSENFWDLDSGPIWELLDGGSGAGKLHDVDCKFLFSYWKQCFGNSQQLFLVFVRAEPTVIGGSNAGHTPSQLGARAVALVWREPVSSLTLTTGNSSGALPHRMRILFYHQFD